MDTITAALAVPAQTIEPSPAALTVAKQCLLDWLGVTLAARDELLARILVDELDGPDDPQGCTVLGQQRRAGIDTAVLINGAMGHALDFDDVILSMGHPTAPVAPVVFALAEQRRASGRRLLEAFITGVEAECRVARLMGPSHYGKGWHGTATFGSFGAAAAACRLLGVDGEPLLYAYGLAGTQAAGLKAVFGSMSKPLHAGKAAQNGLLAARLAARGFTSDPDILGSEQGFAATQSARPDPDAGLAARAEPWVVEALFKFHAACYLTHNAIEAGACLLAEHALRADQIEAVTVRVGRGHLRVCNIQEPATGLECKFSLRMTVALALSGEDTFQDGLFSDATAVRPDLLALRRRISVEANAPGAASIVEVRLKDGRELVAEADVGIPERDLAAQQTKIERKFRLLATPKIGPGAADRVVGLCRDLESQPGVTELLALCRG